MRRTPATSCGIGGWVLREACQQMRRWRDRGLPIERIAVNVSYRQFLAEDLAEHVRAALAESGLPGTRWNSSSPSAC